MEIAVVGGGIGGLSLALYLHQAGLRCTVYEATSTFRPLGVGINLLPHATRNLYELGLGPAMEKVSLESRESCFFNRHGQLICKELTGRYAGYKWPHLLIHRADLHDVLVEAVRERLGRDALVMGYHCTGLEQDDRRVVLHWQNGRGDSLGSTTAALAIGCDGVHSVVRKPFYPDEGPMRFAGINQWRGTARYRSILSGVSIVRCGALSFGKFVSYPVCDYGDGTMLSSWNVEVRSDTVAQNSWNQQGRLEDFIWRFENSKFDWLDLPDYLGNADLILEYPMVDRDPIPRWTFGRVTLLGDAAHPMYPRGGNGGAQSILDARCLASMLKAMDPLSALEAYQNERLPKTSRVVLTNRSQPPDYVIETVEEITGGRRFGRIEDVISADRLQNILDRYKDIAGFDVNTVNR